MESKLAPIILFIYNRPSHTQHLLNSLSSNEEAKNSLLYIYCDGAKEGESDEMLAKINETRLVVKNETRFKDVIVIEQSQNKGLANSIIEGVTDVIKKHNKVIVLEDDLVVSQYFLFYMNDSLSRYEKNNKVGQIGACNFFACGKRYPNTFFLPVADCLGWATWKNRWGYFSSDAQQLLLQLNERKLIHKFNAEGTYDFENMLKSQIGGSGTSWAVRWHAVCLLNDWLILYPNPSFTNHIKSEEATNANINITPPLCHIKPSLETIEVIEIPRLVEAFKKGNCGVGNYFGNYKMMYRISKIKKKVMTTVKSCKELLWDKNNLKINR